MRVCVCVCRVHMASSKHANNYRAGLLLYVTVVFINIHFPSPVKSKYPPTSVITGLFQTSAAISIISSSPHNLTGDVIFIFQEKGQRKHSAGGKYRRQWNSSHLMSLFKHTHCSKQGSTWKSLTVMYYITDLVIFLFFLFHTSWC